MNIFRKNTHTEQEMDTRQPEETSFATGQQPATEQQPTAKTAAKTAEEAARAWWKERHGEAMPEEVSRWMKQLTRTEARRINIAQSRLSPQQLARIEDARRLAETKLHNIEASLQRLYDQQDWIHRFNEKKHELTEHRNRLYDVTKRLATVAHEEKDLERFEAFETVQGVFQRMQVVEQQSRQNKQEQSELSHDIEELRQQTSDHQKRLTQLTENRNGALKQVRLVLDQIEEANRILGARSILDLDERATERLTESVGQQRLILEKEAEDLKTELGSLQEFITQQSTARQAMEPHQGLLEHHELALALLGDLQEIRNETEQTTRKQEEDTRRQQEMDEMLNRVYQNYQTMEADIKMLNEELHLHRQQNLGRSSYALQERAMQLKSRRQMLISAQSLWHRIQLGYTLIEEKTQLVNRLRLSIENLQHNIENLENTVIPMRQLCHEKEYTLTLSKSQNVIQLRGDLKEGVSCTVCGATHHPYHSDTMIEQSKLISDLRTDFELLQAELLSKEEQLRQLQTDLTAETVRRDTEEDSLSQLRQRQMEDVKEWSIFAPLDRSFQDCTPGTNFEARTAMLRQLIENAERDADNAMKELEEYNFHQTRINETAEALTRKEQDKNDLTLRLNELNTGCQVLARQVEQDRLLLAKQRERYSERYEELGKLITLNDWYAEWKSNHEGLRMRIAKMAEAWQLLNADILRTKRREEVVQTALEEKRAFCTYLDRLQLLIREDAERRRTVRKEGEKTYENMLGTQEVKDYFDSSYQALQEARKEEERQRETTQKALEELAGMNGRQTELLKQCQALDSETIAERSRLDVWMRKFNASHPPVQYSELEQAFDIDRDWNVTREKVRALRIEAMLEQARVDALRSAIVALQAEGMRPSAENTDEAMASIVAQQKQLEKQRQDVLMQLAEQRIALNTHEQCVARLKAEEEEMYEKLKVES